MSNLFISHSSHDNAAAKELQTRLEEQGHHSVFLDLDPEAGIQVGVSWERTLYTKLRACRAVIALCSDSYLASQWCFAEIALARMEGKALFVLQIDPWSGQTQMPSILTEEQYVDLRTDKEHGYQRLWNGFRVKGIVPAEARDWKPEEPPYPGLRVFREEDAPIFFGRDEEIREGGELLNRVRRQGHPRLVMVLGSSGSGKSSLVRAGIFPQLRRDRGQWRVVEPFRPGRHPVRELAAALSQAFDEEGQTLPWEKIQGWLDPAPGDEPAVPALGLQGTTESEPSPTLTRERLLQALSAMEAELTDTDDQVATLVRRLKFHLGQQETATAAVSDGGAPPAVSSPLADAASQLRLQGKFAEATVVLVIDQFEELLGHEAGHPASRFLEMLRVALEAEDSPLLVLGTMRSDYLAALQRSTALQGLGFRSLSVGPMSRDGMRQIIEEPARLGQLQLESGLSDLLLEDTETSDALPLLAFTLRMMWDRYHDKRRLEIRDYKELGGLRGAVAQVADETLETALTLGEERDLRDAFLSLARPAGEGLGWARQASSWEELSERVRPMLQQFIDRRLLVKRADDTVEVAHEALFRSWNRLKGWLDENAEGLHLLREIQVDAQKWQKAAIEEKNPYLWRGGRLVRALELRSGGVLALKDLDTSFVEASERAEKAQAEAEAARQRRELLRTRYVAVAVGMAFVVAMGLLWYALGKKEQAEEARLVAEDQTRIAVSRVWLTRDPTRAALVLLEMVNPEMSLHALPLMAEALTGRLALLELRGHTKQAKSAVFSPRSDRIVTTSMDETARLWDSDGSPILNPDGKPVVLHHGKSVASAAFDTNGEHFVTASNDHTARLWRSDGTPVLKADGSGQLVLQHEGIVNQAAFQPGGDLIVTGSDDHTARVWRSNGNGKALRVLKHDGDVNGVAFSPQGDRIVTASTDSKVRVWGVDGDGDPLVVLEGHDKSVFRAVFDTTGTQIVSASKDHSARLWNADGSGEPVVLDHGDEVYDALFSPSGRIYTASKDKAIRVWSDKGSGPALFLQIDGGVPKGIHVSTDGRRLIAALTDGSVRVWGTGEAGEPVVLPKEGWVNNAVFCPDSDRVLVSATGEDDIARIWGTDIARPSTASSPDRPGGRAAPDPTADGLQLCATERGDRALTLAHKGGKHWAYVTRTAVPPGADRVVTVSDEKTAWLWNDRSGEPVPLVHDDGVNGVSFSPKGDRIITASADGTARIWSIEGIPLLDSRGKPVMLRHDDAVWSTDFNLSGDLIVTASSDKTARVWNADGTPFRGSSGVGAPVVLTHDGGVFSAAFSPAGDRIITGASDFNAYVWRLDGGAPIRILEGHDSRVRTVSFSPAGDRILTGSDDGTARVWSLAGHELLVLAAASEESGKGVWSAVFDATGERAITTINEGNEARVWHVTFDSLGSRIRALTGVCLDPGFRESSLREDPLTAERRFENCETCLHGFRERAAAGNLDEAFRDYRDCLLQKLR